MASDTISVNGFVATPPRAVRTGDGLPITTFRLATSARRYDPKAGQWVDGDTNWFTVSAFRALATNIERSIEKGQRVLVQGRLRVRTWVKEDRRGTSVEIVADGVGHDLSWGTATFTKVDRSPRAVESDADHGDSPDEALSNGDVRAIDPSAGVHAVPQPQPQPAEHQAEAQQIGRPAAPATDDQGGEAWLHPGQRSADWGVQAQAG